jgi:ribosomal protein L12E/L44/L45/RPP1/RPP2
MFRHGDADVDIRLHAARGALAPRAHEQLALLMVLSHDADPRVCEAAAATIDRIPSAALAAFLARVDVPETMREWYATRGTAAAAGPDTNPDAPLIEDAAGEPADPVEPAEPVDDEVVVKMLSMMTVLERLKLAMRGTREQRAALIRDPAKMVSVAVMSSPKLTEPEVEAFSRMTTVNEEVLRIIGANKVWTRNYSIALALARNPKSPLSIAMQMAPRLTERDMKQISSDRNVPEAVRLVVRKFLVKARKG